MVTTETENHLRGWVFRLLAFVTWTWTTLRTARHTRTKTQRHIIIFVAGRYTTVNVSMVTLSDDKKLSDAKLLDFLSFLYNASSVFLASLSFTLYEIWI